VKDDYWYLCCACGSITAFEQWTFWRRPDTVEEEDLHGEDAWLPNEEGRTDPMCRCPVCGWEHMDTDDGVSGMYDGTLVEMIAQRQELIHADRENDHHFVLHEWNDRLMEREADWQGARKALREFEHVAGEPLAETAAVAASSHAFLRHTVETLQARLANMLADKAERSGT